MGTAGQKVRPRIECQARRNTLCNWDNVVADTVEPVYKLLHRGLL